MIEGVDTAGLGTSDTTGMPASGEHKGHDTGRLRPGQKVVMEMKKTTN